MASDFPTERPSELEQEFHRALHVPARAQTVRLKEILRQNATSEYGQSFSFEKLQTPEDYQSAVPIVRYEDICPHIEKIRRGAANVLTTESVLRFHVSSGTTSASKIIPFTASLRREFAKSIELWLWNIRDRRSQAVLGRSYWVVSASAESSQRWEGAVPVEFDQDASYLPERLQPWFVSAQCVPHELSRVTKQDHLLFLTAVFLLLENELSLISLWSPSFWITISQFIRAEKHTLVADIANDLKVFRKLCALYNLPIGCWSPEVLKVRAAEVENADLDWRRIWPCLSLISSWTDGFAATQVESLQTDFPGVPIQGKGLLATEGVVTIPFDTKDGMGLAPVLVPNAHFYEFRSTSSGRVSLAHQLVQGDEYEVILTTGGGLYRYQLGDKVVVDGSCHATPRLRFLSKTERVSDLCGEKLHEEHVKRSLDCILSQFGLRNRFVFLAPSDSEECLRYRLFAAGALSHQLRAALEEQLERSLCENFNYALCRRNGQLEPVQVQVVTEQASVVYKEHKARFSRLSTVKTSCFDTETGWERVFAI
ncbi:MAG: GH3 auxin-responsive promoter family protein [Bdellovibrionota bacterium]